MANSLQSSNSSLYTLFLQTQNHSTSTTIRAFKFKAYCFYNHSIQVNATKYKRKPRPSFFQQIQHKWSLKPTLTTHKFPWQEEEEEEQDEDEEEEEKIEKLQSFEPESDNVSRFNVPNRLITAPWIHGSRNQNTLVDSQPVERDKFNGFVEDACNVASVKSVKKEVNCNENFEEVEKVNCDEDTLLDSQPVGEGTIHGFIENPNDVFDNVENMEKEMNWNDKLKEEEEEEVKSGDVSDVLAGKKEDEIIKYKDDAVFPNERLFGGNGECGNVEVSKDGSIELPWKRERGVESLGANRMRKRSNTKLADRTLPEHELKRLRNVALRMLERIKVGAAGIMQDLVNAIHDKWRLDEVVKLKFEGPLSRNMKRTHEILESRTGGLVIWRSGSSVVLYRGMTYKLQCVQSYAKKNEVDMNVLPPSKSIMSEAALNVGPKNLVRTVESFIPNAPKYLKELSQEELMDFSELNHLLDDLGPRFKDWCGPEPLPIDADLLPPLVPGYKPPYRLLPYGTKHCLKNHETTIFRRIARTMPPHFALGRSRELQGLAKAMVKLWESSAIAKIAIKRGVPNTRNERMAEELKRLTGGILLSRNKEYIVFYRGNDFLPPAVTVTLKERRKSTYLHQDEEDQARQMALGVIQSNTTTSKGPLVAGTLTETKAATSHWEKQLSSEDVEEMRRESALARRVSLVKHLKNKLALAKGRLKMSEKALAKVQEHLEPTDLPNDLETLTDEERFLFRKIGLSMKPYLLLGIRDVYGGTIENMHLHWKYRELVKIIVKRKNFAQVKHIAISLEAESGGVLVSVDKTTKGYCIIVYRGKNYIPPQKLKPTNLLTKRQALARSTELQRREALKHHILDLQERIELATSEVAEMEASKSIDGERASNSMSNDASVS